MIQADSVLSTPPTNTSPTRRNILGTIAAAGAFAAAIPAATVAGIPTSDDPAFALIAEKRAADIAHCAAIDVQDEAEDADGSGSDAAEERFSAAASHAESSTR
jgi:hypothetical protein